MSNQPNLHELLRELIEMGDGMLGNGPKHPESPNPELAEIVKQFLKDYAFLRNDPSYIEFLETYAGAGVIHPDEEFALDLPGFGAGVSNFIPEEEYPVVNDEGFLVFCDGYASTKAEDGTKSMIAQSFSFDATGKRRWGVYRHSETRVYWYCESFLDWLRIVVENKGKTPLEATPLNTNG